MKKRPLFIFTLGYFCFLSPIFAQSLQPGFNRAEYIELLKISAVFGDSAYVASFPQPERYDLVYRSPVSVPKAIRLLC